MNPEHGEVRPYFRINSADLYNGFNPLDRFPVDPQRFDATINGRQPLVKQSVFDQQPSMPTAAIGQEPIFDVGQPAAIEKDSLARGILGVAAKQFAEVGRRRDAVLSDQRHFDETSSLSNRREARTLHTAQHPDGRLASKPDIPDRPRLGEHCVRGWCCAVLKNLLRSAGRKARRVSRKEKNETVLTAPGEVSVLTMMVADPECSPAVQVETTDFLSAPFSAADLRRVRFWRLEDRIELLCLSDLWRKIPRCMWQRWVMKHHYRYQTPKVLPTPEVLAEPTPQQRLRPLAEALNMKSNTLSQHWRRKKC